jgi:hypothetical protein
MFTGIPDGASPDAGLTIDGNGNQIGGMVPVRAHAESIQTSVLALCPGTNHQQEGHPRCEKENYSPMLQGAALFHILLLFDS